MVQQSVTQTRRCDNYGQCFNVITTCENGNCTTRETISPNTNASTSEISSESTVTTSVNGESQSTTTTNNSSSPSSSSSTSSSSGSDCFENTKFVILFEGKDRTIFFVSILVVMCLLFFFGAYRLVDK
jgi:ABC-type Na+ efflux pump permease subunit